MVGSSRVSSFSPFLSLHSSCCRIFRLLQQWSSSGWHCRPQRRRPRSNWVKNGQYWQIWWKSIHLIKHLLYDLVPMKLCWVRMIFFLKFGILSELSTSLEVQLTSILIVPLSSVSICSPIRYQSFWNFGSGARRIHTLKSSMKLGSFSKYLLCISSVQRFGFVGFGDLLGAA